MNTPTVTTTCECSFSRCLPAFRNGIRGGLTLTFLLFLLAVAIPVQAGPAGIAYTVASGDWSDPSTWAFGKVPDPEDHVVLTPGHQVIFSSPPTANIECSRLTIGAGARLSFGGQASQFEVGGNGRGKAGGILVVGELHIPAGVTVAIDPDGNDVSEEDGVTVTSGGRLILQGTVLHEGTVTKLTLDSGTSHIFFDDSGFAGTPEWSSARLVWRSGARKGRWYNLLWQHSYRFVLDYESRANAARLGEPDHGTGKARAIGDQVTGVGTNWTQALAAGSWWWCDSDGESARIRIRSVLDADSLQLAGPYGGVGCATADKYWIRDENRPYPGVDFPERVQVGDEYRLILPATLRSRYGSDENFDEQIFVRIQAGGHYHFENASFESVGKEAWASGEGSGIRIVGFDGDRDPDGRFDTVEVYRYGGEAGLEWEDSSHFDVDWLFMHWAHPMIEIPNEGHGVKFEHTDPGFSFQNVRVRNARFDRTNDDFVWWSTSMSGTSGVYDSIGKYCPNTASGNSCDAVDTNELLGVTGGQLAIERNLFSNIGAFNGGSCIQAAVGKDSPDPAWNGTGWLARDNICLNLQSVPCLATIGQGGAWDRQQIWSVNNVCAAVHGNGMVNIPNVYQSQILGFGARRISGNDGLQNAYRASGNIVIGTPMSDSGDYVGVGITIGKNLAGAANWTGTTWELTDNVLVAPYMGIRVSSWSSPSFPASGEARISHNIVVAHPANSDTVRTYGIGDSHEDPVDFHVDITDNIFDQLIHNESVAGEGGGQAVMDLIDSNVVRVAGDPPWSGVFVAMNDYDVTTGIDPSSNDYELDAGSGAWTVPTTDGDKPGPRFAGTLESRLPFPVPGLVPVVDPLNENQDGDGDGLIDRWDNCPALANPGWVDENRNGVGDVCETGFTLSDVDNSGVVDGDDLAILAAAFGTSSGASGYNPRVDFDSNQTIDGEDLIFLATYYGEVASTP